MVSGVLMSSLSCDADSVLKTIDIQQSLIARMSASSAASKNWCVTVVSAVTIFAVDKAKPFAVLIALLPVVLFFGLDLYYLALERVVRRSHEQFCSKLRSGTATTADLFCVGDRSCTFVDTVKAAGSRSVWPFYLFVALALAVTSLVVKAT
jgi:hypothetical protein